MCSHKRSIRRKQMNTAGNTLGSLEMEVCVVAVLASVVPLHPEILKVTLDTDPHVHRFDRRREGVVRDLYGFLLVASFSGLQLVFKYSGDADPNLIRIKVYCRLLHA